MHGTKKVPLNQSANDYMANAKKLDDATNAPPTPTVPTEQGNNSGPLADGKEDRGKADWEGDGSYASGMSATKKAEKS